MTTAQVTETVAAPATDVWRVMSDFGGLEPNELIASCAVEGDGVGAVRTIGLKGGGEIIERLESEDATSHTFSYAIINDCPLPVQNYVATVRISATGDSEAKVDWSGTFTPNGAPEAEVVALIEGIYRGGIQRAREKLGV